jgi:hypothetical protein
MCGGGGGGGGGGPGGPGGGGGGPGGGVGGGAGGGGGGGGGWGLTAARVTTITPRLTPRRFDRPRAVHVNGKRPARRNVTLSFARRPRRRNWLRRPATAKRRARRLRLTITNIAVPTFSWRRETLQARSVIVSVTRVGAGAACARSGSATKARIAPSPMATLVTRRRMPPLSAVRRFRYSVSIREGKRRRGH